MLKEFNALDLFSGAGGVSTALKDKFNIAGAIEFDKIIAKSYALNHGEDHLLVDDIRNIKEERLKSLIGSKKSIDLLVGTPPCQGFSKHTRKRSSSNFDIRNNLILEVTRIADLVHPTFILFENVENIINYSIFHKFLKRLANIDRFGYKKQINRPSYHIRFEVVESSEFGVPQKRRRLILIAKRIDIYPNIDAVIKHPRNQIPYVAKPLDFWPKKNKAPFLGAYLKQFNLSKLEAGETDLFDRLHRCGKLSETNKHRIKLTPHDGGGRENWPSELLLECHQKEKISYSDVYGRMNRNDYAPTITGGCITYSKGRFGHPIEDRAISLREASLIQTFPTSYKFTGSMDGNESEGSLEKIAVQIGNAVPVELARSFINLIFEQLIIEKKQTTSTNKNQNLKKTYSEPILV